MTKKSLPAHCYYRHRSGGRVYVYFERAGQSARIHAEPGTAAFALEYAKSMRAVDSASPHFGTIPRTNRQQPMNFGTGE